MSEDEKFIANLNKTEFFSALAIAVAAIGGAGYYFYSK